ncbi:hypothetical protein [Xylanimonas ulmi]|uniref:Uncharacterized protein n=1 Tax=Xylanimonas ulmi TaxID=228973 RepID=A0A4Q7M4F6_9MICO|nr:hypothetical protein [Xylanibacterium ulmi]RZS62251.1 hypothetical protein EV386_2576 [Xylanibacterium ulmi]
MNPSSPLLASLLRGDEVAIALGAVMGLGAPTDIATGEAVEVPDQRTDDGHSPFVYQFTADGDRYHRLGGWDEIWDLLDQVGRDEDHRWLIVAHESHSHFAQVTGSGRHGLLGIEIGQARNGGPADVWHMLHHGDTGETAYVPVGAVPDDILTNEQSMCATARMEFPAGSTGHDLDIAIGMHVWLTNGPVTEALITAHGLR